MTRALRVAFAIAALVACGDDDAVTDAGAPEDASMTDAAMADGAAGGTCADSKHGELTASCSKCLCSICPEVIAACDEACTDYVTCFYHCDDTGERCHEQCKGDTDLTPVTPSVTNLLICIGNRCPIDCGVPQSL